MLKNFMYNYKNINGIDIKIGQRVPK